MQTGAQTQMSLADMMARTGLGAAQMQSGAQMDLASLLQQGGNMQANAGLNLSQLGMTGATTANAQYLQQLLGLLGAQSGNYQAALTGLAGYGTPMVKDTNPFSVGNLASYF
jgi:hypothetical protein